jgi:hypothetical protein
MKKIILSVIAIVVITVLIGIYKFNFTNDDIYVKNKEGHLMPVDEVKNTNAKELKTKSGKLIIVNETHPDGQSISSLSITTKGFKENKLIELKDVDPIEKIELKDLDNNGFDELYLFTRSVGSGSHADFYVFASDEDEKLVEYKKEELVEKEYLKGGMLEGYMGHDTYSFDKGMLVMQFPVYKEKDVNSKPTGGVKKVFYILEKPNFKIKAGMKG